MPKYYSPTWADLLAALQKLTPEQLAKAAVAGSETSSYNDLVLVVTTEPHYEVEPHEEWLSESEALREGYTMDQLNECDFREAGEIFISMQ